MKNIVLFFGFLSARFPSSPTPFPFPSHYLKISNKDSKLLTFALGFVNKGRLPLSFTSRINLADTASVHNKLS